ncbi:Synaptotagmin-11 [Dissostichus eleginoides]|uniref:Synaptotagmin-11 n=1 Tax=Dissostichus eleginoides TaxID=100907 RepID=A0AAD9BY88_DISEL|nr:Synaptotagmin-11 [Dissostichus eleginoides]
MSQHTLAVHLQILLAVGLAVFCYCLVLGCVLCCRRRKSVSSEDKEAVFLSPHPSERVTVTLTPVKQQYEELDGDVLEFPSSNSISSPSEDDFTALLFDPNPTNLLPSPSSSFPMRRLSTPAVPCSPINKSPSHGRASLPSLTKLCKSKAPLLNFTLIFSSTCGTLMVNILGLSGVNRRRTGVFVRATLPPLCPSPQRTTSRRRSLSTELHGQSLVLQVGSVAELRSCTLRLVVFSREFSGLREAALGSVELPCEMLEWEPDKTSTYSRQLNPTKSKLKKSVSSQETLGRRKSSVCVPRVLGQLFVLLQFQTLAQRIKVMVRKAENLAKLTRIPGAADHYVVINLRQDGKVIGTKETKGASGSNPVWNAPFLFDLPPGDISQLVLEFIIMQGRLYTKSSILGRVLIGGDTSEEGQGHWKEMCSRGQIETARWHNIQSDGLH